MKTSEIIALLVAFLGLAGAFQGFFSVELFSKLLALAVGGTIVLGVAMRRLADWSKVKKPAGYIARNSRLWLRPASSLIALSLICVAFSVGAWLVLWFYAINIEVQVGPERIVFWIQGSRQITNKLIVLVPSQSQYNLLTDTSHQADIVEVDSDTPNPQLHIKDFSYPQRQGISCVHGTSMAHSNFQREPSTIEVLFPEDRRKYRTLILCIGGAVWIASVFLFARRLR
jgi:hypothetical protein